MASRRQSIRTKIVALLVVPLVSLLALWSFAAFITLGNAQRLLSLKTLDVKLVRPTDDVLVALKNERRMSVAFLGGDDSVDRSGFDAQRRRTDQARTAFLSAYRDPGLRNDVIERETARRLDTFADNLGELDSIRRLVDHRAIDRGRALNAFTGLLDGAYAIYSSVTLPDAQLAGEAKTYIMLNRAQEILDREDALITGALAAGRITLPEHAMFAQLVSTQRALNQDATPGLPDPARTRLERFFESPDFTRFQTLEDRVLRSPPAAGRRLPVDAGGWHTTTENATTKLSGTERFGYDEMTVRANKIAERVILELALAGGLGLVAVITSVVVATRASRMIIRENRALAAAVAQFGQERMPRIVELAQRGENLDPEEGTPNLEFTLSEVDGVYRRFVDARRAVVEATVREAAVRRGVSEVFVNLARRNQALLHRQLSLLDNMERRVEDPDELEDLFRLDHLATRMRRHAEGLVILSGKPAGRSWRHPVPLVDVARGAIAEVEDYTRVRVLPMTRAALTGAAVADTIHLLAELIENATLYSPPELPVQVSGQIVANGFAIEVEDRGLGLAPEALAEANEQLANPREFDPAESSRLGLFVVARLARRHDIKVSLRISPYGGTTAIVLIPATLIVDLPDDSGPQDLPFEQVPGMRAVEAGGPPPGSESRSMSGSWAAASPWGAPPALNGASGTADGEPGTAGAALPMAPAVPTGPDGRYGPRYDDADAEPGPVIPLQDAGLSIIGDGVGIDRRQGRLPGAEPAEPVEGSNGLPAPAEPTQPAPAEQAEPAGADDRPAGLPEGLPHRRRQGRSGARKAASAARAESAESVESAAPVGSAEAGDTGGVAGGAMPADEAARPARTPEPAAARHEPVAPRRRRPGAAEGIGDVESAARWQEPAAQEHPDGPAGAPTGPMGLPRRRRQASLAPQLRDDTRIGVFGADRADESAGSGPGVRTDGWGPAAEEEAERPPEAVRTMMAAMQQGWKRGRADAGQAEVTAGQPLGSGTEEDG